MNNYRESFKIALDEISPIGDECWRELEKLIVIRKLKRKEFFSQEGESFKSISLLFLGVLRMYYIDVDGNEWNEHFFVKNDFVTSGVSPELKNISNIQAITESNILSISFNNFIELSDKYPEIGVFVQRLSFKCLANRQKREQVLQSNDALTAYHFFQSNFPYLEDEIQQFHIASYIGVSPTQLSRIKKK